MKNLVTKSRLGGLVVLLALVAVALLGFDHQALAEEAGHSGGLPQFNPHFFLTQLFWLTVIFGTFYLLVQGVAIPKVVQVIETRDAKIAYDISRAEQARNEAAKANAYIEDKIVHARDHARTIIALANREADNVATARIAGRVRDAERRIAHAREDALRELPALAAGLVQEVLAHLGDVKVKTAQLNSAMNEVLAERKTF